MKNYLPLLFSIGLLTSCGTTNIKKTGDNILNFNSNDWLLDRYKKNRSNPLNIDVSVTPTGNNKFFVDMDFKGDPQDPLRGINPTAVSIFSFCINSFVAHENNNNAWIFGMRKEGFTKRKRSYRLIIGNYEAIESRKKDNALKWSKVIQIKQNAKNCKKLIKSEYLW